MSDTLTASPIKRGRGRPPKALIEANKHRGQGKVGRPPGDNARIAELKARLLSTSGDRVITKVVNIALDDEHPGQMAALKLCIDRVLPLSLFEKDARTGNRAVTINITGVGEIRPVIEMDATDVTEVTDEASE